MVILLLLIKLAVTRTKNGLTISIGCNRKKIKSNHLLAPFISTPINGTKKSNKRDTINIGKIAFFKKDIFTYDIISITEIANTANAKCLEK